MNRSIVIAATLFVLIALWVVSWSFLEKTKEELVKALSFHEKPVMKVSVRDQKATPIEKTVLISGRTAAARRIEVRAQTSGIIIETETLRGAPVETGDLIARIEIRDRRERLEQAEALLEQARLEYDASLQLSAKGYQSDNVLAGLRSAVRQAEAQVKAYTLDMSYTAVGAPIKGVLLDRVVETGDFVNVGDLIGIVLEMDPLIIRGDVTEHEVIELHEGQRGSATLANGSTVEGFVRYVAPQGDERSRTFPVELQITNKDYKIPAGITAQVSIPVRTLQAHKLSPAMLSLDKEGELGIKVIDENHIVHFKKVDIVKSTNKAVWLGGLPEQIHLITVGHGFVRPGDTIEPVWESIDSSITDDAESETADSLSK